MKISDENGWIKTAFSIPAILCGAVCGGMLLVLMMSGVHEAVDIVFGGIDLVAFIEHHPVLTAALVLLVGAGVPLAVAYRCELRKLVCRRGQCPFGLQLLGDCAKAAAA